MERYSEPSALPERITPEIAVVALVTSTGGLSALSTILKELKPGFPAAILVDQHLGGTARSLVEILGRRTALPVSWLEDGSRLVPGTVQVCPPLTNVEVLPDGTCALTPNPRSALSKPLDFLLTSLADSYGPRALAVVLTGMGKDGAVGAQTIKQAGGMVLVQSEETAEQSAMPHAVIELNAVDLVLPLDELGAIINSVVSGGRLPRPYSELEAAQILFKGNSEVAGLLRQIDWVQTPLGPVHKWPASLKAMIRLMLDSLIPMALVWGSAEICFYNDPYRMLIGQKHPGMLGRPNREAWPEIWQLTEPLLTRVFRGESILQEDTRFPIIRQGTPEEGWFKISYSPVCDDQGAIAGILSTVIETTQQVLLERRLRTLQRLSQSVTGAGNLFAAFEHALTNLAENTEDLPFVIGYLQDKIRTRARLVGAFGVEPGKPMTPPYIELTEHQTVWPLSNLLSVNQPIELHDLTTRFHGFHLGTQPEAPTAAILLPIKIAADSADLNSPQGALIMGLNPRLPLNVPYHDFIQSIAARLSDILTEAYYQQKERERWERLAELDQAKTDFFSNVSHEFRTPLTLMLAPLEELLRQRQAFPAALGEEVEVATRNARRLLTLVNTLLDFSQIQAGQLDPRFEPTDLATLTTDIANLFHHAAARAGLQLRVDCPPLPNEVWVDREMWEKIVSNLLSNALKFTFTGEILVQLRALPQHVELVVQDTGVGIPAEEVPHLFKRFHRVRGTQARTYEGSGIGLALVHELVRRHHGRITVRSQVSEGSRFIVWVPLLKRFYAERLPAPESSAAVDPFPTVIAATLAEEAEHWNTASPESAPPPIEVDPNAVLDNPLGLPDVVRIRQRVANARLLIVDDNADMRDYFQHLLSAYWQIELAGDGLTALERAQHTHPDLILADVMLPELDGFGLLREIHRDETLKDTVVILVTARAEEEAAIEGLLAGADDYITKPFSARELIARISAQLELARVRRTAEAALRTSEARFRSIFENAAFPIVLTALEDHRAIVDVNPAGLRLFEFQRDEVIGHSLLELGIMEAATFEAQRQALTDLREHGTLHFEATVWKKTGQTLVVSGLGNIVTTAGKEHLLYFLQDITERKRAEEALRASEEKYRTLFESIDEGFCIVEVIFDANGKAFDLLHLEANEAYERYTGLRNIVGKRAREIVPEGGPWLDFYGNVALTGEPARLETYLAPDVDRWISSYASRVGGEGSRKVAVIFNNVTERKRREASITFLNEVSHDLVRLSNIDETMNVLGEKIGQFFDVQQCMFAEPADELETSLVSYGWHAPGSPDLKGVYRMQNFFGDELMSLLMTGEPLVVNETQMDARVSAASYGALGIRSFIIVPLIRGDKWQFQLSIIDHQPRVWRSDEIELIQELTTRIWMRLERARAEAARRKSEEKYRALFENMTEMFQILEPIFNEDGKVRDFCYIQVNRATELLTGKTRAELEGKTALEVWGYVEDYWFEMLDRTLTSNEPVHMIDYSRALDLYYDVNAWKADEHHVAIVFSNSTERRRMEDQLRYQAELLDQVFDAVIATDAAFCIRSWNHAASTIYGWTADEVMGKNVDELLRTRFVEQDRAEMEERLQTTGFMQTEVIHQTRDGRSLIVHAHVTLLKDPQDHITGTVGILRDITERKRAEAALRASEERLQRMIETETLGVLFFNPQGTLIQANDVFLRMSGYTREQIERGELTWQALTPPEWLAESEAQMEHFAQTGRVGPYEKEYFMADGSRRWMLFTGRDIGDGLIGEYCIDINDRKRMEENLREREGELQALNEQLEKRVAERTAWLSDSEAKFRALVEATAQIVWTADVTGRMVEDSPSWRAFTGQTLEESLDRGWLNAVHPDDREYTNHDWQRAVKTQQPLETHFRLWHASTRTWHVTSVHAVPLYHTDGSIRGWVGMNMDLMP